MTHPEIGRNLIARFVERVKDHGVAERTPLLEGKSMHITMASTHKPKSHDAPDRKHAVDAIPEDAVAETPDAPDATSAVVPEAVAQPAPALVAAPAPAAPADKKAPAAVPAPAGE